jgi:oxygen-dependent protoporphyrinogen oxidase
MQVLPDTLADHLKDDLRPETPATSLNRTPESWTVNGEEFDAVVMALPAAQAAPLLSAIDPESSRMLSHQTSSSSATLSLVFDRSDLTSTPEGFGFMAAHPLSDLLVGCTWTGNKFSGREAPDRFVCRLFLGGPEAKAAIETGSEEDLIEPALRTLRRICPFVPESPLTTWLQLWPKGNPGYTLGHLDWLASVRQRGLTLGDLYYCGSSYGGVSVSDCVKQAQETAQKILGV